MRILLINPPFQRLMGVKSIYFPNGLGYLAAVLREEGFVVGIYNAENPYEKLSEASNIMLFQQYYKYIHALRDEGHYVWQEVKETLSSFKPDLVGITVMTAKYGSAIKVSSLCRGFNPSIKVIWGGPHPTIQPKEALQNISVDFVVRGEGEVTIVELCQALAKGDHNFSRIAGLSFKENGEATHNQARKLIENLDEIPLPAKDLSLYSGRYSKESMGGIITSRGCPFDCAFCGAQNIWERKVRFKSPEIVIKEIVEVCKRYKTKEFWFWDDSFTINRNRVFELCQKIIEKKLNILWGCTTRVDIVDDELLKKMKEAGCNMIEFGIESGSERILKLIKKNISLDQVREAVKLIRKHRIDWKAFFMVGFPDEMKEDIEKTKSLIKELDPRGVVLSIFTPYAGSELYDRTINLGLISSQPDWSQFSHQSPENHFVKNISKKEFQKIVTDLANTVDSHNYTLSKAIRYTRGRSFFYIRHPIIFFRKAFVYIRILRVPLIEFLSKGK